MASRQGNSLHRPVTVTIYALLVLIIAVHNLIRFWSAIQHWDTLSQLGIQPGPFYIALTGLIWAISGFWLAWTIWTGRPGVRIATIVVASSYLVYYWLDRLIFQNHTPQKNTPFVVGITILVVFYTLLTLSLPSNQEYFSRKHGQ